MKKIIMLLCVIIVSILLITGCSDNSTSHPLSESEASLLIGEVIASVTIETTYAMMEAIYSKGSTKAESAILYLNDSETVNITGTISYDSDDTDGDTDIYPVNYTMNVTLINFIPSSSQHTTLMNGTATWILNQESVNSYTYNYSGDITTVYDGEEYECTMSIQMTMSGNTIDYSGTYTVDDYTYTYTFSYTF